MINVIFKRFAPKIFPKDRADEPVTAELIPTNNSEIEVAKLINMKATKYSEILKSRAIPVKDLTKDELERTKNRNDAKKMTMSHQKFMCILYHLFFHGV